MGLVPDEGGEEEEEYFVCTRWVRTRKWMSEKGSQTLPDRISALV